MAVERVHSSRRSVLSNIEQHKKYFLLRDLVVTELWLGGHKITWSIKKKCRLDNQLGSNIINIYTSVNDYKINYYNNIYFFL